MLYNIFFVILENKNAKTEKYFCQILKEIIKKMKVDDKVDFCFIKSISLNEHSFNSLKPFLDDRHYKKTNNKLDKHKNFFFFFFDLDEEFKQRESKMHKFKNLKNKIEQYFSKNNYELESFLVAENLKNIETGFFYPFTNLNKNKFEKKYYNHKSDKLLLTKCISEKKNIKNDIKGDAINKDIFKKMSYEFKDSKNIYKSFFETLDNIINN